MLFRSDQIQAAKQVDLLTYLQTRNPSELIHVSGDTYCTREHDSLKNNNGMWNRFSYKDIQDSLRVRLSWI